MQFQRHLFPLCLVSFALSATTGYAAAQCLSERISSSNGTGGDRFGRSIAVSGDNLLVGVPQADRGGAVNSGSAYLYERSATGFVEVQEFLPTDPVNQEYFGEAVAINGDWAVVGVFNDNGVGSGAGAVFLWQRVGNTWVAGPKIVGSDTDDFDKFGTSVGIADGPTPRLAVGATWPVLFGTGPTGAVYIFEYDSNTGLWNETQVLRSTTIQGGDLFGASLDFDGERLVVGATGVDGGASSIGAIYVFDRSGSLFVETQKLQPPGLTAAEYFGHVVTLDGDRLAAGGRRPYIFDLVGGTWTFDTSLVPAGVTGSFGSSMDLVGDNFVASSSYFGSGGTASMWSKSSGVWIETGSTSELSVGDYYGRRTILDGDQFLVSADSANTATNGFTVGEVYAYPFAGNDCNANGTLDACDVFSGTSADNDADGVPDECGGTGNYCSSTANSSGSPATISATGSSSVGSNSFGLTAGPVPNTPGIFFYGMNQADSPFGNGRLCVGAPQFRLSAVVGASNQASYAYDLTLPPTPAGQITAGSTWNFQFWFRDPGVGANFDTSDGVSVSFTL